MLETRTNLNGCNAKATCLEDNTDVAGCNTQQRGLWRDAKEAPSARGVEVMDPNNDELVAPPNSKAGDDGDMDVLLDVSATELNEKPNDGAGATIVVVVEPDANKPKLNLVAAPEKRLGVDAAEEEVLDELIIAARKRWPQMDLGWSMRRKSRRISPVCSPQRQYHRIGSMRSLQSQWQTHRRGRGYLQQWRH